MIIIEFALPEGGEPNHNQKLAVFVVLFDELTLLLWSGYRLFCRVGGHGFTDRRRPVLVDREADLDRETNCTTKD